MEKYFFTRKDRGMTSSGLLLKIQQEKKTRAERSAPPTVSRQKKTKTMTSDVPVLLVCCVVDDVSCVQSLLLHIAGDTQRGGWVGLRPTTHPVCASRRAAPPSPSSSSSSPQVLKAAGESVDSACFNFNSCNC